MALSAEEIDKLDTGLRKPAAGSALRRQPEKINLLEVSAAVESASHGEAVPSVTAEGPVPELTKGRRGRKAKVKADVGEEFRLVQLKISIQDFRTLTMMAFDDGQRSVTALIQAQVDKLLKKGVARV